MKVARLLAIVLCLHLISAAQQTYAYIGHSLVSFPGPQVYKDSKTGTLLYVETDGRHAAAISPGGKLLWNRDPFRDASLPLYRTKKPQIIYLDPDSDAKQNGAVPGDFVAIAFNNSQFGRLRIGDGEFVFGGQD